METPVKCSSTDGPLPLPLGLRLSSSSVSADGSCNTQTEHSIDHIPPYVISHSYIHCICAKTSYLFGSFHD